MAQNEFDISTFRGKVLKSFMDEGRSWGMYDLWSNAFYVGRRYWQGNAFKRIVVLLRDLDIIYEEKNERKSIEFKIQIPGKNEEIKFIVHLRDDYLVVYAEWPHICPKCHFDNVIKYLNYTNCNLAAGFFYLANYCEMDSAKVCFKLMQLYSEVIDYQVMLCYWLIAMPMRLYEQYYQGLNEVIEGKETPESAYETAYLSKFSNLCDWYNNTESPRMFYNFPKPKK